MQYSTNQELVEFAKGALQNLSSLNGDKKKMWLEDENAKICWDCKSNFDLIKRRHHCRFCGRVFCEACSSKKSPLTIFSYDGSVRVCSTCFLLLDRYQKQISGEESFSRSSSNSPSISPPVSPHSNSFGNTTAPLKKSGQSFVRSNSKSNIQQ